MRNKILLALLAVIFLAAPAFASVQNLKVSGSVNSTWLYRENFDLGSPTSSPSSGSEDETQNIFFTQTRLGVAADLTDNVSAVVSLINERVWGNQNDGIPASAANDSTGTDVDIDKAYVTLREMLYSPLTVVIGRQPFKYGNSFIVDSSGTNNSADAASGLAVAAADFSAQTSQDAVRLIFDYNPLKIEVLASKIDANNYQATAGATPGDNEDVNLYGINSTYDIGDSMNTQVEGYFFAKVDNSTKTNVAGEVSQVDSILVPGLRASTNPIEGLNVQGEVAWQGGTKTGASTNAASPQRREALGYQFIANYQLPVLEEYKPTAQYVMTHVSGDNDGGLVLSEGSATDASGERYTAWDPMFENQAGGKIYNTMFNLSNANIHTVKVSANPIEDVTAAFSWTGLWLDEKVYPSSATTATLVQPDGASETVSINSGETELGNEFDVDLVYNYTEDVQIGGSWGWFFPGDFFIAPNDNTAFQSVVNVNVNF